MHAACESNNLECVKLLCERGADPEKIDHFNHPPIDTATRQGHIFDSKIFNSNCKSTTT